MFGARLPSSYADLYGKTTAERSLPVQCWPIADDSTFGQPGKTLYEIDGTGLKGRLSRPGALMLDVATFLPTFHRRRLYRAGHFLALESASAADWSIASRSSGLAPGRVLTIRYGEDRFEGGDFAADTIVRTAAGSQTVRSGLHDALIFAQVVFGDRVTYRALQTFDPCLSLPPAMVALALQANLEQPDSTREAYDQVVVEQNGARLLHIERGQATVTAESRHGALLAFHVFADHRYAVSDVAERSAAAYRASLEDGPPPT